MYDKERASTVFQITSPLDIGKGEFPITLKTATVIPILKKGDKTNLNNYRHISLLPVISKIFEKVINNQLTSKIDNGYIDDNQFGFRQGFSTEDALTKFIDQIEKDLALGNHSLSLLMYQKPLIHVITQS